MRKETKNMGLFSDILAISNVQKIKKKRKKKDKTIKAPNVVESLLSEMKSMGNSLVGLIIQIVKTQTKETNKNNTIIAIKEFVILR